MPALCVRERLPAEVGDRQPGHLDRPSAGMNCPRGRGRESVQHQAAQADEAIRRLRASLENHAGKTVERAADGMPKRWRLRN
jgi:hypothetical protein